VLSFIACTFIAYWFTLSLPPIIKWFTKCLPLCSLVYFTNLCTSYICHAITVPQTPNWFHTDDVILSVILWCHHLLSTHSMTSVTWDGAWLNCTVLLSTSDSYCYVIERVPKITKFLKKNMRAEFRIFFHCMIQTVEWNELCSVVAGLSLDLWRICNIL